MAFVISSINTISTSSDSNRRQIFGRLNKDLLREYFSFLASTMWIYCIDSNDLLDIRSDTTSSHFSLAIGTFSHGKTTNEMLDERHFEQSIHRLEFYLQMLWHHIISKISLLSSSEVCLLLLPWNQLIFIDVLLSSF